MQFFLKKTVCTCFLTTSFFFYHPIEARAFCCDDISSVTTVAFLAGIETLQLGLLDISRAIMAQGTGIQATIKNTGRILGSALDASATHIAESIALQMDTSRKAEFRVKQALDKQFGLGLNICCGAGDGIAAGGETGSIMRNTVTTGSVQSRRFVTGREAQTSKNILQQTYAPVNDEGQVTGPDGKSPLSIIEPKNGTYTKEELAAVLNIVGTLADPFPATIQKDLTEKAKEDYDAMNQQRDWLLQAQRHAPLADWVIYHSPIMPVQEWFDNMKKDTGLHHDVTLEDGMMSPRMYNEFSRDAFLSTYAQTERLKLNERGLLQELVKVSAHQYMAEVETLTTLKRISVQLALNDPSILQKIDEYLNAFKTQLNTSGE